MVETSWIGHGQSAATEFAKAPLNRCQKHAQGSLPLDGFHQSAGLGVNRPYSLAVVYGDRVVGLGNDRAIDGYPQAIQTGDVRQPGDAKRPCSPAGPCQCVLGRNRSLRVGRRMFTDALYTHGAAYASLLLLLVNLIEGLTVY